MPDLEFDRRLRKVSELRRLCLDLPHLSTPAERRRLERFEEIVLAPASASEGDLAALATGWRDWWRAGRHLDIAAMASRLSADLITRDRDVAMYAVAAQARRA